MNELSLKTVESDPEDRVFAYYRRLGRLRQYVDEHYTEEISVRTAASVAGLQPNYFSSFFSRKVGISFREWLMRYRVRKATEILRQRNAQITEVALLVGFQNTRTFQRQFKRYHKMTPSQFRLQARP